eukprot:TRINITY_DN61072_c0_g1_i1.p1 TRINITY_DN61072_c0_g1~~TRINITY_DN61072_c0_g1_i1.p1  ORF type:complete len:941 (+),score=246.40 TRINITY_DN61072_c0_g1_i1:174-2996(+)
MNRLRCQRKTCRSDACGEEDQDTYDHYKGEIIVVDFAALPAHSEDFEGRSWLESCVENGRAVGFGIEYSDRNPDDPVTLLMFADTDHVLLLRTHRTQTLPNVIKQVLNSMQVDKFTVRFTEESEKKMKDTFGFSPLNAKDLLTTCEERKGIELGTLQALAAHFDVKYYTQAKLRRSDWAAETLSKEQCQFAADTVYFTYMLQKKVEALRDEDEGRAQMPESVLDLQEGWKEQGIRRLGDGLKCMICDKGPMNTAQNVQMHIDSKKHKEKLQQKMGIVDSSGKPIELEEKYVNEGIKTGADADLPVGHYRCMVCKSGPFQSLQTVDSHIAGQKHKKAMAPKEEPAPAAPAKPPYEDDMWNLPDYVTVQGLELSCTHCKTKVSSVMNMMNHLDGSKHTRTMAAKKVGSEDFVIYNREKGRLEWLIAASPVVRSGHKRKRRQQPQAESSGKEKGRDAKQPAASEATEAPKPAEPSAAASVPAEQTASPAATKTEPMRLRPGWAKYHDEQIGDWYYNEETGESSLEIPAMPAEGDTDKVNNSPAFETSAASVGGASSAKAVSSADKADQRGDEAAQVPEEVAMMMNLGRPHDSAVAQADGSSLLTLQDGSTMRWTARPDGTWRKPEHKKQGWVGELEREKYSPPHERARAAPAAPRRAPPSAPPGVQAAVQVSPAVAASSPAPPAEAAAQAPPAPTSSTCTTSETSAPTTSASACPVKAPPARRPAQATAKVQASIRPPPGKWDVHPRRGPDPLYQNDPWAEAAAQVVLPPSQNLEPPQKAPPPAPRSASAASKMEEMQMQLASQPPQVFDEFPSKAPPSHPPAPAAPAVQARSPSDELLVTATVHPQQAPEEQPPGKAVELQLSPAHVVPPASLPAGWLQYLDTERGPWYYHEATGKSQFEKPTEVLDVPTLPPGWEEYIDELTGAWYWHEATQTAQFDRPVC